MQIYMFERLTQVISNLSCRYGIAIRTAEQDLQGDRQGEIMSPQINCQGLSTFKGLTKQMQTTWIDSYHENTQLFDIPLKVAHQSNDKKSHKNASDNIVIYQPSPGLSLVLTY